MKIKQNRYPVIFDKSYGPIFGESEIRVAERKGYSNLGIINGAFERDASLQKPNRLFGGQQIFNLLNY